MNELLEQINAKLDALLSAQPKTPIVPDALYLLKEVAALCGCDYVSISRAAHAGNLKTHSTPIGRQAWGRDVTAWINGGGKTGYNKGGRIKAAV